MSDPLVHRGSVIFLWDDWGTTAPVYDPATGTWGTIPRPSDRRANAVVRSIGDTLIVWGGQFDGTPRTLISGGLRRDGDGEWRPMAANKQPARRLYPASAWTGRELLVWGGRTNNSPFGAPGLSTGGAYDPGTDTWRKISSVGAPTFDAQPSLWSGSEWWFWDTSTNHAYDPREDRWRTIAPSPGGPTILAGDVALLVRGSETWRYEPRADLWEPCAPFPDASGALKFVHGDGGAIVAITGANAYEYLVVRDAWIAIGSIPRPEPGWLKPVTVVIDRVLYTFHREREVHRLALPPI